MSLADEKSELRKLVQEIIHTDFIMQDKKTF